MSEAIYEPLNFQRLTEEEQLRRSEEFLTTMQQRRTVRHFSPQPVPFALIENAIATAGTAPSGAHQQPWSFVVVSDAQVKHEIRLAAEAEEYESYTHRMSDEWKAALARLGTDWHKDFIDVVPYLIVVFAQRYGITPSPISREGGGDQQFKHYYVDESVGIAVGLLIASLHQAGLATVTHTPSPMNFLSRILNRPRNERAYVLLPVGYPANDCQVPQLERKRLNQIMSVV